MSPPPMSLEQEMTGAAPAAAPMTTEQEMTGLGVAPALFSGFARGAMESGQQTLRTATGQAFTDQPEPPPATDPLSQLLAQPMITGEGYKSAPWWAAQIGHGVGSGAPMLGGATLGALAGGAVAPEAGPVGPVVGGALGSAIGAAMPALSAAYADARSRGLDPDAATTEALQVAGLQGVVGGLMGGAGGLGSILEGAVASRLSSVPAQALLVQPGLGAAGQVGEAAITGKDLSAEQLAQGYVTNAAIGTAMAVPHALMRGREATPEPTQESPAATPAIPPEQTALEAEMAPVLRPPPQPTEPTEPIAPPPEPPQTPVATQATPEPTNANGPDTAGRVPVEPEATAPVGTGSPDPNAEPVGSERGAAPGGADGAEPAPPIEPGAIPAEPTGGVDANAAPPVPGSGGAGREGAIPAPSPAPSVPGQDNAAVASGPDPGRVGAAGGGDHGERAPAAIETPRGVDGTEAPAPEAPAAPGPEPAGPVAPPGGDRAGTDRPATPAVGSELGRVVPGGPDGGRPGGDPAPVGGAETPGQPVGPERPPAEPPVAAAAEQAPPGFDPTVQGNIPRDAQHTNRPSRYMREVAAQAGVGDPDAFVSLPPPVQVRRLSHALVQKHGLAGIDIHPGSDPRVVLDQLGDALHNLQSMAAVMGVPNDVIGFGGQLRIWLGPQTAGEVNFGGGRALGVYRPDNRTIYMPGRSNSFAHEWTHALDDELVRRLSGSTRVGELLSTHAVQDWTSATPRGALHEFGGLMASMFGTDAATTLAYLRAQSDAMRAPTPANRRALQAAQAAYRASDFLTRARGAGGARGAYLSAPYEMLARSHEAYMAERIGRAGGDTEFVAKPEQVYLHQADANFRTMFPGADERQRIFDAWDRLHGALRREALYPNGLPADIAPRNDLFGLGPNHWGQWADPNANPQLAAALRARVNRQVNQLSLIEEGMHRIGFQGDGSDPGYRRWYHRMLDGLRLETYSPRAMLGVIHDRVPAAAQAPLRRLIDHLTTDPGSGRTIAPTFEEAVKAAVRHDNNDYAALAQKNGIVTLANWRQAPRMTVADQHTVHELLTQAMALDGLPERIREAVRRYTINRLSAADQRLLRDHWDRQTPTAPENLGRFASDLRFLLDRKYYELQQAGLPIPYMEGHFPRVFDDARIWADRDRFRRQATRANIIRSERGIGDDGEALVAAFRNVRDHMDPQTGDDIDRAIAQGRAQLRANPLPPGQAPTPAHLVPDRAHQAAIHRAWAEAHTENWVRQVISGSPTSFDTRGPAGAHLRERVLPPEADALLRDYLITDPHAAIPNYMHQINRRMEFSRRFGHDGRGLDELVNQMADNGARPEDVRLARDMAEMITGRVRGPQERTPVRAALNYIHAVGTMALMPRAVFSALSEPMAVLPRTGSLRTTYVGFAHQVREIFRTGDAQRIAEIANYVGTVTSAIYDTVLTHRTGATYSDAQHLGPMMVNYFRRTGLTSITNSQRRAALVSGNHYLRLLTDQLDSGTERVRRNAAAELRDLGIADQHHEDFTRWLRAIDGVPDIADLEGTANGDRWRAAIVRFTDQVNQDPNISEKAIRSNSPSGKLIYGLMSFNYGFFNNVVGRFFAQEHREREAAQGFAAKANVAARFWGVRATASVAALWFGQLASTVVREAAFSGNQWDEHERKGDLAEWLSELAFQRVGLNGPLDPVIQAITGLKYNKSVSDLALGAQAGWMADNVQAILESIVRASPHTNTSSYNGYKALYNLLGVPAAAVALTALPGGRVVGGLATAGMMKLTSRSAADTFAESIVGPKGAGDETTKPKSRAPRPPATYPGQEADKNKGGSNAAVGLIDDFLPMIARNVQRIPRAGLVGAGVAGGAYALHELAQDAGRFTEPPAGQRAPPR